MNHIYSDPGEFETGVIGKITAPGLVCNDGVNECASTHTCTVRITIDCQSAA